MARVKRGKTSNKKHKKILKAAKKVILAEEKILFVSLSNQLKRSLQYSYRDRRRKKRSFKDHYDPKNKWCKGRGLIF